MRVVQVISHLDLGGAEEVAISLMEGLYQDIDFTVFAVQGIASTDIGQQFLARLTRCNIQVISGTTVGMKYGGSLHAGLRLSRLLKRVQADVVHLHTEIPEMTFACAGLFGLPPQLRVIRTIHNTTLWPAWARIGAWAERRLAGARVAAVSQGGLAGLLEFQRTHAIPQTSADTAQVIFNGVAAGPGLPSRSAQRATPEINVLFAGRFEHQKGIDLLPRIAEKASRLTSVPVTLHIVGSGSHGSSLAAWAATQSTSWTIRIRPPVPNLAAHLREGHFDVALIPSRFEGLALIAIEALLAGIPVVATRVAGMREVFPENYPLLAASEDIHGIAGVLAQAIDQHARYSEQVREYIPALVKQFSKSGMAEEYLRLYRPVDHPASVT